MSSGRSGLRIPSTGAGVASQAVEPDWVQFGFSTPQLGIVAGDLLLFDTVVHGNGTLTTNAAGQFTLKAGKSYRIDMDVGVTFSSTAGLLTYRLYDIAGASNLSGRGVSTPVTTGSHILYGPLGHHAEMVTVGAADVLCGVRVENISAYTQIVYLKNETLLTIKEIPNPATSAVSDPGAADGQMLFWDHAAQKWTASNPGGLITTKSVNYAITDTDAIYTLLMDASGAPRTVTLPVAANNIGRVINVKKIDSSANPVTAVGNGTDLIDGGATAAITPQWQSLTFHCDGSNWYII